MNKTTEKLTKDCKENEDKQSKENEDKQSKVTILSAKFPGLVDIVNHEGKPAFLILVDKELQVKTEYEKDGYVYIPPPKEKIPFLLPGANEIINH